ncbi:hypothetical protein [Halopseudomonas laoshanensis]|uniref:hypothetical protein n=1 Tax=Halopseudomonas laoshanensis TaxID=2268758 RepID=UPI0011EC107D|nr:hypothetical protein [Halopseudomonas laoshanensis]
MKIPKSKKARVRELISTCKKYQGEYLPNTHGSGSWATTYSREFICAAAELYLILEKSSSPWPIDDLSQLFMESKIPSCRGAQMTRVNVEYLYKHHLKYE